jgi:branched-chain amino acid aminotransferase
MTRSQRGGLSARQHLRPLSAKLPWKTLGFDFTPTSSMLIYNWKDGAWDGGKLQEDFTLKIHALSNALHYGQAIFEGLKAFHCKDGMVRVFNAGANAQRLHNGCNRLHMPTVPSEMFNEALDRVIKANVDYVPPYGSGGALYLRPNLFGHGAAIGLGPAPEYHFTVVAVPVGAYYKGGLEAIDARVVEGYDRAAPRGVGNIKAAGNYAPDVTPSVAAKKEGFPVCLYLDAKTNSYVEEFSTSNFIGVTKDGTIVTPTSDSILPSCTKGVVLQAARDLGFKVEQRPVSMEEVGDLAEVAACGTAVVLTPIKSITRGSTVHKFEAFTTIAKLYDAVTGMQTGELPDTQGLLRDVCERPHEAC